MANEDLSVAGSPSTSDPESTPRRTKASYKKVRSIKRTSEKDAVVDRVVDELLESSSVNDDLGGTAKETIREQIYELLESNKFDELVEKPEQATSSRLKKAKDEDVLTTLDGRLVAFSSTALKDILTSNHIKRLPSVFEDNEERRNKAFDKRGKLQPLALGDADLQAITSTHTAFLMAVASMIYKMDVYPDETSTTLSLYVPTVLRELGIESRPDGKTRKAQNDADAAAGIVLTKEQRTERGMQQRKETMLNLVNPFDTLVGVMPNGSIYRLLTLSEYDADKEVMTISAPFLFELRRYAERLKGPQIHRFLHSTVANEPNDAAVELASHILGCLVRRGNTAFVDNWNLVPEERVEGKHAPVVYRVKYATLIDECPQLRDELREIERDTSNKFRSQYYNNKLKRTFEAAFRIIEEKSELPQRCKDLHLPKTSKLVTVKKNGKTEKVMVESYVTPTKSCLTSGGKKSYMVIYHWGLNIKNLPE